MGDRFRRSAVEVVLDPHVQPQCRGLAVGVEDDADRRLVEILELRLPVDDGHEPLRVAAVRDRTRADLGRVLGRVRPLRHLVERDQLAEVNRPNLKYQYDIYHMQRMEGNLIDTLRKHIGMMGHIQVADSPERHEPGTGEIHYAHVLAALDELGYRGYIGLEYNPATSSEASFSWLPANRRGPLAVSELAL